MIDRLHEVFELLLDKFDCKIVEFNAESDHAHLFFQYHPEIQLSKLVNSLKSVSSRKLRQEFLSKLEKTYYNWRRPIIKRKWFGTVATSSHRVRELLFLP